MKLQKPTLLLDKEKCLSNIQRMKAKADGFALDFRPHFKTHQSATIGAWFKEAGNDKITVSSISMAQYFAKNGWSDITLAFPMNIGEMEELNVLLAKAQINIMVENVEVVDCLATYLKASVGVFIKIDAGYHRTGLPVENHGDILNLVRNIQAKPILQFKGFIIHNGHSYHASGASEVLSIHDQSLVKLAQLKSYLQQQGVDALYSIGDTPSMSLTENFANINEIRPGNFVFYDVMQQRLGACQFSDIAVALACPVVAKHPSRNELVIYGGAVHLSKDFILDAGGVNNFGHVVELTDSGWGEPIENTFVKSLSQEHGIIKVSPDFFNKIGIGDFIGILPIHSCLTLDAMGEIYTLSGEKITTIHSS